MLLHRAHTPLAVIIFVVRTTGAASSSLRRSAGTRSTRAVRRSSTRSPSRRSVDARACVRRRSRSARASMLTCLRVGPCFCGRVGAGGGARLRACVYAWLCCEQAFFCVHVAVIHLRMCDGASPSAHCSRTTPWPLLIEAGIHWTGLARVLRRNGTRKRRRRVSPRRRGKGCGWRSSLITSFRARYLIASAGSGTTGTYG
jgi:hypothetical protein